MDWLVLERMTEAPDTQAFQRLIRRFDPQSSVLRTWSLTGGVSAQVTALEVERFDGKTLKMIVRRHGAVDLKHNPRIARDEFKLLDFARSQGLQVPAPIYLDESCGIFPSPVLVIEFIESDAEFPPSDLANSLLQMAAQLSQIHDVSAMPELSFLPFQGKGFGERPIILDHSMDEERIRKTLESAWPLAHRNEPVLLQGDYWPGNILWKDGELAAVIDWEDAQIGDPLADLGNARLEVLWAFGIQAMQDFTSHYRSMTTIDFTNLPYWDLCAALGPCSKISEWGLEDPVERQMRERHKLFTKQAFDALNV